MSRINAFSTWTIKARSSVEANEVLLNHVENVYLSTVAFTCASVASQISSAVIVLIIPFISHPFLSAIVTVSMAKHTLLSAPPAEEDAPRTLGTVTVIERANTVSSNVATRLPAEAMETPFTVLSVSGDIIEETGATRLSDTMRYATTVSGTDNFGNAGEFFSSRGFQLSAGKNYFRDGLRYRKYG